MVVALLYGFIALLDASAALYRQAAGRNARINKRNYLLRAAGRGLAAGIVADAIAAGWLAILSNSQRADALEAGKAAMFVAAPMVGVFMLATALRAVPKLEVRTLASAALFGPLTFVRPYAIGLCALVAIVAEPMPVVVATTALFVALIIWWTRYPWPIVSRSLLHVHRSWARLGLSD